MTSAQSAEMLALARASGRVAAVCYNTRFYPLNQHAHGMMRAGELGELRLITGQFHQDWLAKDTDWNWRLEAEEGGPLRSVSDIGTHWVDLTNFITGQRPVAVMAELATFIPERQKPLGPVETFSATRGATETRRIATDDAATILLRYGNGGRGVVTTSQISHGRKGLLAWDISGSKASAAWSAERPEDLWIGHREAPNQILLRDPSLMNPTGAAAAALPGGHPEGFADTWAAFFSQVYRDVANGGRASDATWATFDDGHYEMLFCDAVLESAARGHWVQIKEARLMHLGILTAPFAEHPARSGGRLCRRGGFPRAGDRLLARRRGREAPLCRDRPPADRDDDARARVRDHGDAQVQGTFRLGPRLLPQPAAPGRRPPRGGHRAPDEGHHRRKPDGRPRRQHLPRRRPDPDGRPELVPRDRHLRADRRPCAGQRRDPGLRELPDDLLP